MRYRRHWGSIANSLAKAGPNTRHAQLKPFLTEYADQFVSNIDRNITSV